VPSSNHDENMEGGYDDGELHLTVHVPKPVEIFVRPPLPVGKQASQWYRYQELTEEEEELRPKWHY
jgi:nitric-oxide synthase, plant